MPVRVIVFVDKKHVGVTVNTKLIKPVYAPFELMIVPSILIE